MSSAIRYKLLIIFVNVVIIVASILVLICLRQYDVADEIKNYLLGFAITAYLVSTIGIVSIGVDNLCLLLLYALAITIPTVGGFSFFVMSILDSIVHQWPIFTLTNLVFLGAIGVGVMQLVATYTLLYHLILERLTERRCRYRLTTAMNIRSL